MQNNNLPTCPQCRRTDQVQKVTSVYGANTKEWTETHSRTDAWGNSETVSEQKQAHTSLGLKLQPPPEPTQPTHPGLWYGIGLLVAFVLLSVLCPIALVPFSLLLPLFGVSFSLGQVFPAFSNTPTWGAPAALAGAMLVCLVLPGVGLLAWLALKVRVRYVRDMQRYNENLTSFQQQELPRWQRAKARWEQLFYCMRDETVFIPSEGLAVKTSDVQQYLFDPSFNR